MITGTALLAVLEINIVSFHCHFLHVGTSMGTSKLVQAIASMDTIYLIQDSMDVSWLLTIKILKGKIYPFGVKFTLYPYTGPFF